MNLLLLNAGSSSLKATLLRAGDHALVARAAADWAGPATRYECRGPGREDVSGEVAWRDHAAAARRALADLLAGPGAGGGPGPRPAAVGHRIVHGGEFSAPVRITPEVRARIAALSELAPLHNPPGLATLAAAEEALPDVPHVAVFDTAFHASLPPAAYTYALPEAWTRRWGLRRYGFHGLSHSSCAERVATLLGRPLGELRLVTCHLGHGCSAAAVRHGTCIDTTMGYTPLDGLVMATRSGAVDPGLVLHVQRRHGLDAEQVEHALTHESGLLGLSGLSGDMREVLAAARAGHARAQLALDVYAHRVRQAIGALAASLGGLDAVAFTGGVGENAPEVRAAACRGLEFLGLQLDGEANAHGRPDRDVAREGSPARVLVVEAREDLAMAAQVERALGGLPAAPAPAPAPERARP